MRDATIARGAGDLADECGGGRSARAPDGALRPTDGSAAGTHQVVTGAGSQLRALGNRLLFLGAPDASACVSTFTTGALAWSMFCRVGLWAETAGDDLPVHIADTWQQSYRCAGGPGCHPTDCPVALAIGTERAVFEVPEVDAAALVTSVTVMGTDATPLGTQPLVTIAPGTLHAIGLPPSTWTPDVGVERARCEVGSLSIRSTCPRVVRPRTARRWQRWLAHGKLGRVDRALTKLARSLGRRRRLSAECGQIGAERIARDRRLITTASREPRPQD